MSGPKHRPPRTQLIIHAGVDEVAATVPEWWGALDSDTESRRLRFAGDGRRWLDEGELPPALEASGCYEADVVGTEHHTGLAHPRLVTGARVSLRPRPVAGRGTAIEVWIDGEPVQVGYLRPEVTARVLEIAERSSTGFGAVVAGEVRDAASKERRSVTVLMGPVAIWSEDVA